MGRAFTVVVTVALAAAACTAAPGGETTNPTVEGTEGGAGTVTTISPKTNSSATTTLPAQIAREIDPSPIGGTAAILEQDRTSNDGSLGLETGLDLFSSVYGALPGVTPSITDIRPGDGSLAIRTLLAHWDELDAGTQEAVEAAVAPGARSTVVALGGEAQWLRVQADTELDAARVAATAARDAIAAQLGSDLGVPIHVSILTTPPSGARILADASPFRSGSFAVSGRPDACSIRVFPGATGESFATTIAHEVFHCFQFSMVDDVSTVLDGQDWIVEGQAEWVGARIGGVDATDTAFFTDWVRHSPQSMFSMAYQAVGFYWALESTGIDPWGVFRPMLGARGAAAVAATGGDPSAIWTMALTTILRRNVDPYVDVPTEWDFTASDVPPAGIRGAVAVSPGSPFEQGATRGPYARTSTLDVDLEGDVVHIVGEASTGAHAFVGDGPTVVWEGSFDKRYCLLDDPAQCACPGAEPMQMGTNRLVAGVTRLDAGPYRLRIESREVGPDDLLGFTDGTWRGVFLQAGSGLRTESLQLLQGMTDSVFAFTVSDGTVLDGSYLIARDQEITMEGANGSAHTVLTGALVGSPCDPSFAPASITVNGTLTTTAPDGSTFTGPIEFTQDLGGAPGDADWVFTETGPDRVAGTIINDSVAPVEEALPIDFFGQLDLEFVAFRVSD